MTYVLLVILLLVIPAAPVFAAGDIWVDANDGSDGDDGSSPGLAKKTINGPSGAVSIASAGDTIKVLEGDYGIANGEVFPINVPTDVTIRGWNTSPSNPARIGGDIATSSIDALFQIGAVSGSESGIVIRDLEFPTQDVSGIDAPSALLITGAEIYDIEFKYNVCRRGEMNDSGSDDRATIQIVVIDDSTRIYNSSIEGNLIEVTARGGIEATSLSDDVVGEILIGVWRNIITNPAETTAEFGMRWDGVTGLLSGNFALDGNTISSTWETGLTEGIVTGIEVLAAEFTGQESNFFDLTTGWQANLIEGCSGDGVRFVADATEVSIHRVWRNVIRRNGGSGVRLVRGDDGVGYFGLEFEGNFVVDNVGYGYAIENLGDDSEGGTAFINETIANNGDEGFGFDVVSGTDQDDAVGVTIKAFLNVILRENNSGGDQVVGLDAYGLAELKGMASFSNWQGFGGSPPLPHGNIDADPLFVDAASGDYHLDAGSPCIDKGNVTLDVLAPIDFDVEARVQDSNYPCSGPLREAIDIGADEVPEPDCP